MSIQVLNRLTDDSFETIIQPDLVQSLWRHGACYFIMMLI